MTYYRYYLLVINKYDNMSFYHKLLLRINELSYSFDLLTLQIACHFFVFDNSIVTLSARLDSAFSAESYVTFFYLFYFFLTSRILL